MSRFVEGADRRQDFLLPASLDDYVSEDNPVRAVEAFIDALDLKALEFAGMTPAKTGRPAYHPATMLKIYLYGYLNRVQSSRRLEREAQRNVEVMWLTGRLAPDFKTIANFRQANGTAIRAVCSQFIGLCRQLNLFKRAVVAIDGSKMKAVNNRDKNYTAAKVRSRMQQVQDNIVRHLEELDRADRAESDIAEPKAVLLTEKIARLRDQMRALEAREQEVRLAPDQQVSLTDPDARAMTSAGRRTSIVGYNLQAHVAAPRDSDRPKHVITRARREFDIYNAAVRARTHLDYRDPEQFARDVLDVHRRSGSARRCGLSNRRLTAGYRYPAMKVPEMAISAASRQSRMSASGRKPRSGFVSFGNQAQLIL